MNENNKWNDFLQTLTDGTPDDELEADIVLADIAGRLSAERIRKNMSQKEFAKLLGVSQGRISKMESGECNFSVRRLIHIAHTLSIPLKILFGEKPVLQDVPVYHNSKIYNDTKPKSDYGQLYYFPISNHTSFYETPMVKEQ